jgi:DNA-binding transcriptional MocR family regulator
VDAISFARGVPAPECLPVDELADCARAVIERDGREVLSYGGGSGYSPLREWIGERHGVDARRVLLTNGGLQGLVLLAQQLCTHGSRVLVERPTYDRPLKILRGLGAEIDALPMDEEGLDPEAVEQALAEGSQPAFLYTIPTFQNPSGRTLSLERRRRVVELARKHELLIVEDDPYGLVRFDGETVPTLFSLDPDRVVYTSSFSKTVAPGVRVGYFILPPALHETLEASAVATYISPVLLGEATVHEFVRRGRFEPNLERVRGLLRIRRDAMLDALEQELAGTGAHWSRPAGGYFLWLDIPGVDAAELLDRASASGVTFVKGADFGGAASSIRLAYSYVSTEEIREGVGRLAGLVRLLGPAREPAAAPL